MLTGKAVLLAERQNFDTPTITIMIRDTQNNILIGRPSLFLKNIQLMHRLSDKHFQRIFFLAELERSESFNIDCKTQVAC